MSADGEVRSADPRDQSIGELVKELAAETSTLVRQELDLAKAEMTERGKRAGKGAATVSAAAIVGLLAAGALTACLIAALTPALSFVRSISGARAESQPFTNAATAQSAVKTWRFTANSLGG